MTFSHIGALAKKHRKRFLICILLAMPILVFCLPMLLTSNKLPTGDADYLMQTVLAARISLLEHGQFPWWNPWVSGGVPLFANPQFGLLALPTVFGLIFGPILGYKLAILAYFLLGFYGLLLLFRRVFATPLATAVLLAYIWTFGTFLTYRSLGHYTFLTIQFFPLIIYFFLARKSHPRAWLYLGLFSALAALAAAHNMTILGYILVAILVIFECVRLRLKSRGNTVSIDAKILKSDIIFLLKAGGVFFALTAYRLFFTLQYLSDYPRSQLDNPEPTIGVAKGLFAIAGPLRQFHDSPKHPQWTWMEASAYIGILTCLAAALILFVAWQKRKRAGWTKLFSYSPLIIIGTGVICFILGLGNFIGSVSPYSILRHLPVLSSMRVASRWLVFCSLLIIIFISTYRSSRFRLAINILLLFSVVELFFVSRPELAKPYIFDATTHSQSECFSQKKNYNSKRGGIPYDENLTDATLQNRGQIYAGDSLIDTRPGTPYQLHTIRQDFGDSCTMITTNNAQLETWTPNKLVLQRTGPGDIKLNMNPGRDWLVNNKYVFLNMRIVEPGEEFIVRDEAQRIEIKMQPRYSAEWLAWKFSN